jgi:hypothetical protein
MNVLRVWFLLVVVTMLTACDTGGPHGNLGGYFPADPAAGVGQRFVVFSGNSGTKTFDRTPASINGPWFYDNVVHPFSNGQCVGDAHYEYDVWAQRYWAVSMINGAYACFAVSAGNNPFSWYSWLLTDYGGVPTNVDYPTLSIGHDTVQLSTRLSNGGVSWTIDKWVAMNGGAPISFVRHNTLEENVAVRETWHGSLFSGATRYTVAPGETHGGLRLYRMRGVPPNVNVTTVLVNTAQFGSLVKPRQYGGPTLDDRVTLYDAVMDGPNRMEVMVANSRNGRSNTRVIRLSNVNVDFANTTATSHTNLNPPAGFDDTWNGSVDIGFVANQPHWYAVNCAGPGQYVGICAGMISDEQKNNVTEKTMTLIKRGNVTYAAGLPSPQRWGDFITLRMDPYRAPNWLWVFGQVADGNGAQYDWHTQAMQFVDGCIVGNADHIEKGGARGCPAGLDANLDQVALAAYPNPPPGAAALAVEEETPAEEVTDLVYGVADLLPAAPPTIPEGLVLP